MAKRILVAEDDPDNRCIVVKVLTLEGYETLETDDGRSALALARRERPDLIVMDLGMPGMDFGRPRAGSRRTRKRPISRSSRSPRGTRSPRGGTRGGIRWLSLETLPAEDHP